MAVVTSASISQSADGTTLTFTDTSTGYVGAVSRSMLIYDPNGQILGAPIFVGVSCTFAITADAWFSFVEVMSDSNGNYTQTRNYLSVAFYQNAFSNAMAAISSYLTDFLGAVSNLNLSQDYYQAALRFYIGGFGVAAQQMIEQANFYVETPYYA